MYSVILSNQAIKNLTGIVEYIAADNPDAADKIGFELVNLAMSLDFMPYRGSKVLFVFHVEMLRIASDPRIVYWVVSQRVFV